MNQYTYKKINDRLSIRLNNWYKSGILGCGPDSLPWLDLSDIFSLPDNCPDIILEIESVLDRHQPSSGGVSDIIPPEINGGHSLPYYIYNIERYVPPEIQSQFKNRLEMNSYLFEHALDRPWAKNVSLMANQQNYWYGKNTDGTWMEQVPLLRTWIESLDSVFTDIGRVQIFVNTPGRPVAVHRDDTFHPHSNHFVNIQLGQLRPAFVYDELSDTAVPITSRVYMFNEHDLHGVGLEQNEQFTLRIDGKFTDSFSRLVGLVDGVVWNTDCRTGHQVDNLFYYDYTTLEQQ